jgi:hypothetical protein
MKVWIEKTIVKGRPDRKNGNLRLGSALWSPIQDKRGADIYKSMREVEPGDVILHLTDNKAITGVSIAASKYTEGRGIEGSDWSGPAYIILLKNYVQLNPPLGRETLLQESNKFFLDEIRKKNKVFYNSELTLNQGAYLTEAPIELVNLIEDSYLTITDKQIPYLEHLNLKKSPNSILTIYEVLKKAEQGIIKAGFKYKSLRKNSRYVWVEDSNNTIGRKPAHYEFILRKGNLYLELHFEDNNSKTLFHRQIENLPTQLEWFDWNGSKSIRHKNSYKLEDVNVSVKIIEDLIEFDKLIGDEVRAVLLNQSRKFWLYAPGENARKWNELYNSGQFAIGWDDLGSLKDYKTKEDIENALLDGDSTGKRKYNDALACYEFSSVVQPGDIVIAKKGKKEYVGWGVVTGDYFYDNTQEEYKNRRLIDWKTNGEWTDDAGDIVTKTLTDITKYADYVQRLSSLLKIELNETAFKNTHMEHPLNTILYGPPGTGKTYHTVLRSAEIIENRKISSYSEALAIFKDHLHDQIEFITFHQNYSYEDFIQGLRPDTENNNQLTFDRKDGVFKVIADRALQNLEDSGKPSIAKRAFEEVFNEFINPLVEGEVEEIEVKMKKVSYFITAISNKSIDFRKASGGSAHTLSIGTLKKMYAAESVLDIQGLASYYSPLLESILKIGKDSSGKKAEIKKKNYVIIIDEINRANISRVFGELITLIEPDKRSHGDIPMEATLPSGDTFIVPSNLYIMGTMNTADKSIALLDIALRRRFEFEAMYPKYQIEGQEIYDVDILKKINEQIIKSKGHDFQIGHAYFLGENKDLVSRMNKKVIPLLLEYYMNDEKEVKGILQSSGMIIEENSWPLRITGRND